MKTTIELDDALLTEAKEYALAQGKIFNQVVEEALREKLIQYSQQPIRLKTVAGNGLNPGADLDDDAYLRSHYGLVESIQAARKESISKGVTLENLDW